MRFVYLRRTNNGGWVTTENQNSAFVFKSQDIAQTILDLWNVIDNSRKADHSKGEWKITLVVYSDEEDKIKEIYLKGMDLNNFDIRQKAIA